MLGFLLRVWLMLLLRKWLATIISESELVLKLGDVLVLGLTS